MAQKFRRQSLVRVAGKWVDAEGALEEAARLIARSAGRFSAK